MCFIYKYWYDMGNFFLQCNILIGEGVGGDDFDGEEDDVDRVDRIILEEISGIDVEGQCIEED